MGAQLSLGNPLGLEPGIPETVSYLKLYLNPELRPIIDIGISWTFETPPRQGSPTRMLSRVVMRTSRKRYLRLRFGKNGALLSPPIILEIEEMSPSGSSRPERFCLHTSDVIILDAQGIIKMVGNLQAPWAPESKLSKLILSGQMWEFRKATG